VPVLGDQLAEVPTELLAQAVYGILVQLDVGRVASEEGTQAGGKVTHWSNLRFVEGRPSVSAADLERHCVGNLPSALNCPIQWSNKKPQGSLPWGLTRSRLAPEATYIPNL
jgi:hypothetical protein